MKMKLFYTFILFFYLNLMFGLARNDSDIKITFNLTAQGLSGDSTVYITGSIDQLGLWRPDIVKMNNIGDHTWSKKITINQPVSIEYKYTLSSWEREGANKDGLPLSNFQVKIQQDTIIQDSVYYWTNKTAREIKSTITGTVKYLRDFKGDNILPRDILVWLPPDYNTDKKQHYPVIYMQDGQNVFDAVTSSFGNEWRTDETCDSLIKAGKIRPVIVVGIYNTSERSSEYIPGEKGAAYMNFVVHKLKPFIDSTYRSKPSREYTNIVGSSLGGLISFMLAWEYPDIFSKAICMSPALKINNIDYVKVVKESTEKKNDIFFYIDNGGIELEAELQPGIDEMIDILKEKGYQQGKDFEYIIDPAAHHNESAWAKRFPKALELCLTRE